MVGFEYERRDTYQELTDFLLDTSLETHELGLSSNDEMIYALSVGDLTKPMYLVDGGLHGAHEWRTVHWVKEFAERFNNPENDSNKPIIEEIKKDFCLMVVPCLNTYGYINNSYTNANGVNLNRNFPHGWEGFNIEGTTTPGHSQYKGSSPMSEPESNIIKGLFDKYNVVAHVNTHTSGSYYGYTIENASSMQDSRRVVAQDFFDSMNMIFDGLQPWNEQMTGKYGPFSNRSTPNVPWITEWGGLQDSKVGGNTFSIIFETGSLETNYFQSELGMTGLLLIVKLVHNWKKTGKLLSV